MRTRLRNDTIVAGCLASLTMGLANDQVDVLRVGAQTKCILTNDDRCHCLSVASGCVLRGAKDLIACVRELRFQAFGFATSRSFKAVAHFCCQRRCGCMLWVMVAQAIMGFEQTFAGAKALAILAISGGKTYHRCYQYV